ncbi:hypothetical protein JW711_00530 [Candidatus Woesearchaeota archaeon]|nr:hypothetical protein [Candidatus Woesearchaeota archaeon]
MKEKRKRSSSHQMYLYFRMEALKRDLEHEKLLADLHNLSESMRTCNYLDSLALKILYDKLVLHLRLVKQGISSSLNNKKISENSILEYLNKVAALAKQVDYRDRKHYAELELLFNKPDNTIFSKEWASLESKIRRILKIGRNEEIKLIERTYLGGFLLEARLLSYKNFDLIGEMWNILSDDLGRRNHLLSGYLISTQIFMPTKISEEISALDMEITKVVFGEDYGQISAFGSSHHVPLNSEQKEEIKSEFNKKISD